MAIVNLKWPEDLCPETCDFGRSRNDVLQTSPRTRQSTVIRQGRPLWSAKLTWTLPECSARLAKLRYWLEGLKGYEGSVQIWNFACPGDPAQAAGVSVDVLWTEGGTDYAWTEGGTDYAWTFELTAAASLPAAAGQTTISVAGFLPEIPVVAQGQYLQIGRRLYVAAAGATSDETGAAVLELATPLISDMEAGDPVTRYRAACEMRLGEQSFSEQAAAGRGLVSISATFVETVTDYS